TAARRRTIHESRFEESSLSRHGRGSRHVGDGLDRRVAVQSDRRQVVPGRVSRRKLRDRTFPERRARGRAPGTENRLTIDYQEWRPGAALNGVGLACWPVAGDGTSVPSPTILPDAYVEIVINLGDDVTLEGAAITGLQPARSVVGLLDTAIDMRYP